MMTKKVTVFGSIIALVMMAVIVFSVKASTSGWGWTEIGPYGSTGYFTEDGNALPWAVRNDFALFSGCRVRIMIVSFIGDPDPLILETFGMANNSNKDEEDIPFSYPHPALFCTGGRLFFASGLNKRHLVTYNWQPIILSDSNGMTGSPTATPTPNPYP